MKESLHQEMRTVLGAQKRVTQKELIMPSYLKCLVSQVLLLDPVMLKSCMTYDKEMLNEHFQMKEDQAQREKEELSDDENDYDSYFKCTVTQMNVDPKVLLPVRRIKEAALDYLDKHPWTYELNPKKDDWRNIPVTTQALQLAK